MDNIEFPSLCIVSLGERQSEMAKLAAWVSSPFSVASLIFQSYYARQLKTNLLNLLGTIFFMKDELMFCILVSCEQNTM
jgi:hypothetical protein